MYMGMQQWMSALLDDEFIVGFTLKMKRPCKRPCVNGLGDKTLLFTGLEYMPLLKVGPKRWKWTEIILKSDKLIVNVVVFKLCNCI